MFRFSAHPAFIGVTTGVGDAWNFLTGTWQKWLPAVLVLALVQFLTSFLNDRNLDSIYSYDRYTGTFAWSPDAAQRLGPVIVIGIMLAILELLAGWLFVSIAIGGLRNRAMTVGQIVVRGLWTICSGIVVAMAIFGSVVVLAVLLVAAPPLGILAAIAWFFLLFYVVIRLAFSTLAIFDGFGPIEGLRESWRLSQGSVLRLAGWGLMAGLLTMAMSIGLTVVTTPLTTAGALSLASAVSTAVSTTGSCFIVFFLAVLYESQRARFDPTLYPYPPMPNPYAGGPYAPYPYPPAQNPYAPGPYAPGTYPPAPWGQAPYPGGPYPGGPYPGGPYAGGPYAGGPYAPDPAGPWGQAPYPGGPNDPAPSWPLPEPPAADEGPHDPPVTT